MTSGNFFEMFDCFLFGFFAKPIGDAFFPIEHDVGRLLLTFMNFGAGFLISPLGAIVLGAYVDRVGRRKGLVVTLAVISDHSGSTFAGSVAGIHAAASLSIGTTSSIRSATR